MNWERHFLLEKMELTHWQFCPYTEYLAKSSWRYLFLAYAYKSGALVNELYRLVSLFFIFSGLCWYHSHFSHFGWEIYWLLDKNLKQFLRKASVSNWYQNLDYKLIWDHVRLKINTSSILVPAKRLWGHWKNTFPQNL